MKTSVDRSPGWYAGIATAAALLLAAGCSLQGLSGGSGGETGNPVIVGMIVDSAGNPVEGVAASAIPSRYNPARGRGDAVITSDTTGETGSFSITVPDKGTFNILAVHLERRTRVLIAGIDATGDTVFATTGAIRAPGAIEVRLPDSLDSEGFVYIPGTAILARAKNGSATLDSVPAGQVPSVNYTDPADTLRDHVIFANVTVSSGDTTALADYALWKYSKNVYLNTTAAGAGVNGNVYGFPVLVRLGGGTFPFSQASGSGMDIRFAKPDGSPLAFEIEQWDSADSRAAVWVRMDTVYGNSNAHFFIMRWGAPAAPESNGAAVFDTGNGFAGVWHMNETPAGPGSIRDRTANAFHGTPVDMGAANSVPGIAGPALQFDGTANFITLPAIPTDFTKGITISGWIRYRTFRYYSRLIDWGNGALRDNIAVSIRDVEPTLRWDIVTDSVENLVNIESYYVADQWAKVTCVYDGDSMYTYKEGGRINAQPAPNVMRKVTRTMNYIAKSDWPWDSLFDGLIDELEVSKVARSEDWIKLEYMNQKADGALVEIK